MDIKKTSLRLGIFIMFSWVITAAILVIRAYLHAFEQLLYTRHSNISASSLFISLLKGHTLFILSAMFALLFLVLHMVTAIGFDDILKCVFLTLTAAGFDVCAWNRDVLFLAPKGLKFFWLHTHDTMLLLFACAFLSLLIPRLVNPPRLCRLIFTISELVLGICILLLWINPPVKASISFIPAMVLLILLTLAFFILQFIRRAKMTCFLESFLLLPPCLVMFQRNYLYIMGSSQRNYYLRTATYIMVFYSIVISIYVLVWQLSNIFLKRSQNRRFEEIMKIKTAVSGLLVNYCHPSAQQITALSRLVLDSNYGSLTQTQRQILFDLQNEVNKLNRALRNIGEFESLPAAAPIKQMLPVKLGTIFKYVLEEIPESIIVLDDMTQWHDEYAIGEPYSLIRANTQFCSAIAEIRGNEMIHITCHHDDRNIQVELSLRIDSKWLPRARRICKIVNKGSLFFGIDAPSDVTLYSTHSLFSRHGSLPKAETQNIQGEYILHCKYSLQRCLTNTHSGTPDVQVSDSSEFTVESDTPQVLLFSTSDEEIEMITSYLAYEPYRVIVVTSEKILLHDLNRLRRFSLLIIGSAFMDNSIFDICWMIRERYSLGQLPILLVQHDPDLHTHISAQKLANSISLALNDRFEFCQKVRTLVELQSSVQNTYNTRLAFLQAQMSPHFLFNTMNTIMAMCLKNPIQAYDLLGYFSQYLRSSLFSRDLDRPYPVYEEIDLLTAYLSIEKARFQEQISYEIESNVPDDWSILPWLIEPLVENCVKHGKHGNVPLHIDVHLNAEGNTLSVLVQDNGAGFDPETQPQPFAEGAPQNKSIGLENVRARLKLFYNAPLHIDSAPGKGTRVSFIVNR